MRPPILGQVIHRDIKPENIIRPKLGGKVVLVDFGAAKFATGVTPMSKGTVIGMPEYAAPEQSYGKAEFSSDLYSLGTTGLNLLTQMSPHFELRSGGDWVWRDYLLNPVSDTLASILDKMLEQEAHRRYQSATDILTDLNQAEAKSFYQQGKKNINQGKYREAIDDFTHSILIDSSQTDSYYFRGITYFRLKENQAAMADLQKAAEFYHQQGRTKDAQEAHNRIIQFNSLRHTLKVLGIDNQRLVAKQIFSFNEIDSIQKQEIVEKIYIFWKKVIREQQNNLLVSDWNIIDFWRESLLDVVKKIKVSQQCQKDKNLLIKKINTLSNNSQLIEQTQAITKEFFGLIYNFFNKKENNSFLDNIIDNLKYDQWLLDFIMINISGRESLKKAKLIQSILAVYLLSLSK